MQGQIHLIFVVRKIVNTFTQLGRFIQSLRQMCSHWPTCLVIREVHNGDNAKASMTPKATYRNLTIFTVI